MIQYLRNSHYIISYSFYTLFINRHWNRDYKSELACVKHLFHENTTVAPTDQCSVHPSLTGSSRTPGEPPVTWILHVG